MTDRPPCTCGSLVDILHAELKGEERDDPCPRHEPQHPALIAERNRRANATRARIDDDPFATKADRHLASIEDPMERSLTALGLNEPLANYPALRGLATEGQTDPMLRDIQRLIGTPDYDDAA